MEDRRIQGQGGLRACHHIERVQVQFVGDCSGTVFGLVARLGDDDRDRLADKADDVARQRQLAARPIRWVWDNGRRGAEDQVGVDECGDDAPARPVASTGTRRMRAWAYGLRTNAAWSMPGKRWSSRNEPLPISNRGSSNRRRSARKTALPPPERSEAVVSTLPDTEVGAVGADRSHTVPGVAFACSQVPAAVHDANGPWVGAQVG